MDPDGSNQIRITNSAAYDDQPKWSPDGRKIAFMSKRDGNFEIYSMNADGTGQTRLTNNPAADGFPAWSPDGTKIAFVSGDLRNTTTFEIYVMNADGSNRTRLTIDSLIDGVPTWSPDGTKIVFMSGAGSLFDLNSFEVFVMNANGSNRTRLTNNTVMDGQPSYSPDGTKILFSSGDAFNTAGIEIYLMNADGTNKTQLTNNSVTDGFPAWSPDGAKIVFASGIPRSNPFNPFDETNVDLYVMNANGTNRTQLTNNSVLDWFPDWQPGTAGDPSTVQFSSSNYGVGEGAGSATITVTRSGDTSGMSTVDFVTSDGTASQMKDYEVVSGTLSFAAGETSKTFSVLITDDLYVEGNETITLNLSNPVGGTISGPATVTLTILDNDITPPTTNPLDSPQFFVKQQYYDFLNRFPDQGGWDYWTGQITQCGNDQTCIRNKRVDVSNAFFFELEFQQTGAYVYRLYRASYGNNQPFPNPDFNPNFPGENLKLPNYAVFARDRAQVVGGSSLAQSQLDLANAFVQRTEFLNKYPTSQDGPTFVNAVLSTIQNDLGVNLTSQRTALIAVFNSGGRGAVMYRLADDNLQTNPISNRALIDAEYNRAFVATQYFGYLRRDSDIGGFLFWLGQVNAGPLRDGTKQHGMVCSFITSAEYQQRFSSVVTHTNAECPQ
jgi:hypothetical protein